jgi:hypothetical protein
MPLFRSWIKIFGRSLLLSYIDPGTGSLIIQILIGSVAGVLVAFKMSWKRVKNWIRHKHPAKEEPENTLEHLIGQ